MSKGKLALDKMLKAKSENKDLLKKQRRATLVLNQPVYSKDKNRFFKSEWEEEKESLYFK